MDVKSNADNVLFLNPPNPVDFDKYFPWACGQLSVDANVLISRKVQSHYVSTVVSDRPKLKSKTKSRLPPGSVSEPDVSVEKSPLGFSKGIVMKERPLYMDAVYDANLNLVQLNIHNNPRIPRMIMKIIGLLIPFHKHLTTLSINRGLRMDLIYEISKFLPTSRITEVCLDGTFLIEANYHILLGENNLKYLSLSKCKITDEVVETIASKLVYPCPASKMLSALKLSSNRITDVGVQYLAKMLRSNRQLSYLNLADNMISDDGAQSIFNSLQEFPLDKSEMLARNSRFISYLKQKKKLVQKAISGLQTGEHDKKSTKKKMNRPHIQTPKKSKILEKDLSGVADNKSMTNIDSVYLQRAEIIAEGTLGPFRDPFSPENTERKDRHALYCFGNNTLCYLNLSYNNLTLCSLQKLYKVLLFQKFLNRKNRGLINVVIEGNYLPGHCPELQDIDEVMTSGLDYFNAIHNTMKKSSHSRPSSK